MHLPDPRALHNSYQTETPFPHIVLKSVFDEDLLRDASVEFEHVKDWKKTKHKHCKGKSSLGDRYKMGPACGKIVSDMNSTKFCDWLSQLTGYRNLISDERTNGGGLHMTENGGYLNIHRDYNYLKRIKANRKINAIVFLNPNYQDSWHGELELWNEGRVGKKVPARFGDLAIFNTDKNYHGHPHPLEFPEGEKRKSIAIYYYQVGSPEAEPHGTMYR